MDEHRNPHCSQCQNEDYKYRENNLCTRYKAADGYVARCASYWAEEKHKIIKDYSSILTVGMKNKFDQINYIDLFSGPGKYFDRKTGKEKDGSALIAIKYNYTNIFLNDIDKSCFEALNNRTKNGHQNIQIFRKDANKIAEKLNQQLDRNSLTFCLLDPSKMSELDFSTIKKLTKGKLVDLLINFPIGMDYKRGSPQSQNNYDRFFNSNNWKKVNKQNKNGDVQLLGNELIDIYLQELYKIGYVKPPNGKRFRNLFPIKTEKNVLLYYLIFVSKNQKGYDFCEKIRKYVYTQLELL